MRALLAGYGFLGQKIAEELIAAGYAVTIIRRSVSTSNGTEFVACDLTMQSPPLKTKEFDLAVFCLAPHNRDAELYKKTYCDAQENFLRGIEAGKYVYISSTAVYPDTAGEYAEESATPHSPRAAALLTAEAIALRQKQSCVLRLAGLYSNERPIYTSEGRAYTEDRWAHFIHCDDAARAAVHMVQNNLTGVFNVHDGNPQLRGHILTRLGIAHESFSPAVKRMLSAGKFFATGFKPVYRDYFSGLGTGR